MSNFSITLEPTVGADIWDCAIEAKELCKRLCIAYVVFDFNGVTVNISQDAEITEVRDAYHKALSSNDKWVIC